MTDSPTPPTPTRPAEREFLVTVCQPPDWSDAEMTAALGQAVARLQDAAALYRGPGWQSLPAPRVRPMSPAATG